MSKFGNFLVGFILGIGVLIILLTFYPPYILESNEKLKPEIKLTTDGKTIDTIYVYKLKAE